MRVISKAQKIWASVDHIVNSDPFRQSKRLPAFLRYVVKETLEGRGDHIKSFSIALEVFGHEPTDEISVRTTAVRLRSALDKYYDIHKDDVDVVITLPKGRYIPVFSFKSEDDDIAEPTSETEPQDRTLNKPSKYAPIYRSIVSTILIVATMVVILSYFFSSPVKTLDGITIFISDTKTDNLIPESVANTFNNKLLSDLVEMGTANIISISDTKKSAGSINDYLDNSYTDRGLVLATVIYSDRDGGMTANWHLSDATSGTILWVGKEQVQGQQLANISALSSSVAFSLLGVEGAISLISSRYLSYSKGKLACIPQSRRLAIVFDEPYQNQVRECLEKLVEDDANQPILWGILAQIYIYASEIQSSKGEDYNIYQQKAKDAAFKASSLVPKSFLAQQAELLTSFNDDNSTRFRKLAYEMLEQYPGDPNLKLRIGSRLVRLTDYAEGKKLIMQGIAEKKIGSAWDNIALSLAHYGEGAYIEAITAAEKAADAQSYLQHLLKAMALAELDRLTEARNEIEELLKLRPNYAADAYNDADGHNLAPELIERMVKSVRKAGLNIP